MSSTRGGEIALPMLEVACSRCGRHGYDSGNALRPGGGSSTGRGGGSGRGTGIGGGGSVIGGGRDGSGGGTAGVPGGGCGVGPWASMFLVGYVRCARPLNGDRMVNPRHA
jgi:hypothetical protein